MSCSSLSRMRNRYNNQIPPLKRFINYHYYNYATYSKAKAAAASSSSSNVRDQKSTKTLIYLSGLVIAIYAAVPLYRRFCQATGYGGTVQRRESVEEKIARHGKEGTVATREVVFQFNADVADGMPWKFVPTQREVRVKPGESALAFYTAENRSKTPITGVSTYNVTPMKAAVYFNKIQCFCFEEQRLFPGSRSTCQCFFILTQNLKQILEWMELTT